MNNFMLEPFVGVRLGLITVFDAILQDFTENNWECSSTRKHLVVF